MTENTKKELAYEFVSIYQEDSLNLKIIEEGSWKTNNFDGYWVLENLLKQEVNEDKLIYIYIFRNDKSTFVFRGFGKMNNEFTKHRFSTFIQELNFKK